ncbi:MAG: GNAT family N-acetyltransferase [Pseudomonadota bacterium]
MTPDALAALHGQAMVHASPWSSAAFKAMLGQDNVFLLTTSSCLKYLGGGPTGRGQSPQAAGFVLGRTVENEAELLTLAVDPNHQRQGHGKILLKRFETEAALRHAQTAFLEVARDNGPAISLYLEAGWTEAGRRPDYYPRGKRGFIDALIMRKGLV